MQKLSERNFDGLLELSYWKKRLLRPVLWLAGVILALYAFGQWLVYKASPYKTVYEMTWGGTGLDPGESNFVPQVVVFAGTVSDVPNDDRSESSQAPVEQFEITMRGHDYYHRAEWRNGRGPRWRIVLHAERFWANVGIRTTGSGVTRTGMGAGFSSDAWFAVGRRLWEGTNFVGAGSESPFHPYPGDRDFFSEQFLELKQHGKFKIPTTILHAGWPSGTMRRYTVEKVTFRSDPDTNWFIGERNRMFPDAAAKAAEFSRGHTNSLSVAPRVMVPRGTFR